MKCLQGKRDFSFQIGTAGLSHAAQLLRGSDTRCSMTSKPKRICHFCFLVITGFSGGLFFFLLTYVLIVWDFTDHAVFLSALEVFATESGGSSCPSSSSAGDADR